MTPAAPSLRAAIINNKAIPKEISILWIACFLSSSALDGLRLVFVVFLFAILLLYHISQPFRIEKKIAPNGNNLSILILFMLVVFVGNHKPHRLRLLQSRQRLGKVGHLKLER